MAFQGRFFVRHTFVKLLKSPVRVFTAASVNDARPCCIFCVRFGEIANLAKKFQF